MIRSGCSAALFAAILPYAAGAQSADAAKACNFTRNPGIHPYITGFKK